MLLFLRLVRVYAMCVLLYLEMALEEGVRVAARQSTEASKGHNICRKRIKVNTLIIFNISPRL